MTMLGIGIGKIIATIALVAVAALGFSWWHHTSTAVSTTQNATAAPSTVATVNASAGGSVGAAQQSVSASGDSDANLQADLNTIDTQMNAATQANANVTQSFNDQPIQQAQ